MSGWGNVLLEDTIRRTKNVAFFVLPALVVRVLAMCTRAVLAPISPPPVKAPARAVPVRLALMLVHRSTI